MRISFRELNILFAAIAAPSCGGSAMTDNSFLPQSPVASVEVTIDSVAVSLDGAARATATAKDASGNILTGQVMSWQSMRPDIVMVSSDGELTPVRAGSAVIESSVAGRKGKATLVVRPPDPPDMVSHDFEDGKLSGFGTWGAVEAFDVITDPAKSGRGRVVSLRYQGADGDDNTSLVFSKKIGYRETIYFRGEFYIPVASLGDGSVQRKLVYFKSHEDWGKYRGGRKFRTVVKLTGDELGVDAVYEPLSGDIDGVRTYGAIAKGLTGQTWYTLEVQQTSESKIGAGDGKLRIWLNGVIKFNNNKMQWTDPAWLGEPVFEGGEPLDPDDVYWDTFMVGQQVNTQQGSFDEYRYWNNVAFSKKRIGP